MPSRVQLLPIPKNRPVEPDDVNVIYHILNGSYSNVRNSGNPSGSTETTKRGLGMAVKLTGYDGRMPTGLVNTTDYALDVRNRETTQQRTFAARRADGTIVFSVEGGKAYATSSAGATTANQVLVNGSTAGGVLGGTYPNPSFALATEYHRVYPTMIVAWYGAFSTTLRAGIQEVTDAPGWVFCLGQSVTLRGGSTVTVPNMTDRFPLGAGGSVSHQTALTPNTYAGLAAISTAHTHNVAHTHSHDHAHEHTVPLHSHGHAHGATGLFGPSHSHGTLLGTLLGPSHQHAAGTYFASSHAHDLQSHTHGPGSLLLGHTHNHSHSVTGTAASHAHAGSTGGGSLAFSVSAGSSTPSATGTAGGGSGSNVPTDTHTHNVTISGSVTGATSAVSTGVSGSTDFVAAGINATTAYSGTTDGPSPNATGGPNTTVVGGVSSFEGTEAVTGTTDPAGTGAVTGATATDATAQPATATINKTASPDATAASITNSGAASVASVNAQPPVQGWYWIMKL